MGAVDLKLSTPATALSGTSHSCRSFSDSAVKHMVFCKYQHMSIAIKFTVLI
jgi:hypothetical protein